MAGLDVEDFSLHDTVNPSSDIVVILPHSFESWWKCVMLRFQTSVHHRHHRHCHSMNHRLTRVIALNQDPIPYHGPASSPRPAVLLFLDIENTTWTEFGDTAIIVRELLID